MSGPTTTPKKNPPKHTAFSNFLRVYGVLMIIIFGLLFVGFIVKSPLLAENGGALNWLIWNDVKFGQEHAHVPPMLLIIYVVWGVFVFRAAADPAAYASFLEFTMWANFVHALLMTVQAAMDIDRYWSKFFTDIPFILILAVGIYLWRRSAKLQTASR